MTRSLPAAVTLSTACRMSAGARNCPFLMLTTRPVRAAATSRSVCRREKRRDLQNVGDFGDGAGLGRLVDVGEDRHAGCVLDAPRGSRRPSREPRAAKRSSRVRLALSYDALKMNWHAGARARCRAAHGRGSSACASLSMTHGPAISSSGRRRRSSDRANWTGCHAAHPATDGRRRPAAGRRACARGSPRRTRRTAGAASAAST